MTISVSSSMDLETDLQLREEGHHLALESLGHLGRFSNVFCRGLLSIQVRNITICTQLAGSYFSRFSHSCGTDKQAVLHRV